MESVFLGSDLAGLRLDWGSVPSENVCAGTGTELYYVKGRDVSKMEKSWKFFASYT